MNCEGPPGGSPVLLTLDFCRRAKILVSHFGLEAFDFGLRA